MRLREEGSLSLLRVVVVWTITSSFLVDLVCSTATFKFLVSTSEEYFSNLVWDSSTINCRSY